MADEPITQETVSAPPKQSPFKTITPAAPAAAPGAAPEASASPITPHPPIIKRPTLRRPGEAAKPVTLKPPLNTQPPVVQPLSQTANVAKGIEISHADAAKKVTSRISVSSATAPIPPIAMPTTTPIASAISPAPAPEAPAPAAMEKKMTSRISLESAFSAPSEMPASQPRTIKLKRPGAASAPAPASSPISPAAPSAPLPEGMTPIADAEGAAPAGDENITRRKTIKVKRPGAASGGPTISLTRPDGIATEDDNLQALSNFGAGPKPVVEEDKVNPIFVIAAAIAIIISGLLVWALASQTYGERGAAGDFAVPKGPHIAPPPWLHPID